MTVAAVNMAYNEHFGHWPMLQIINDFIQGHVLPDAGALVMKNLVFNGEPDGVFVEKARMVGKGFLWNPNKKYDKYQKEKVVQCHRVKLGPLTFLTGLDVA